MRTHQRVTKAGWRGTFYCFHNKGLGGMSFGVFRIVLSNGFGVGKNIFLKPWEA